MIGRLCFCDFNFAIVFLMVKLLKLIGRASGMEEIVKAENHGSSAADFVEGGLQEACDDACSICLENYTDSDPSTVTICKHEFHLQCILEWGQRSSQCPMCWQSLRLKDPTSQELFEAVEQERNYRMAPPSNTMIFRHPTFGDFELQHLPPGTNIHELEERIIQHLTAAAAMGRARHMARREGHRSRSHGRHQFMVGSPHPDASSADHFAQVEGETEVAATNVVTPYRFLPSTAEESPHYDVQNSPVQDEQLSGSTPHSRNAHVNMNHSPYSPAHDDSAGPSDLHSFSETLKSRFNAISTRYKESLSKNARGWRERLFSRNNPQPSEISSEVTRDMNAGMATISHLMEQLETTGSGGSSSPDRHDHNTSRSNLNNTRQPPSDTDSPPPSTSVSH